MNCDVFLLGAGRPARGDKPSALKEVTANARALDWQIHSFKAGLDAANIHFLGGYHVQDVIEQYTDLKYTVDPNWEKHSVLYSLLNAPFDDVPVITSYSDTIFRDKTIARLAQDRTDISIVIDSQWHDRYESRPEKDINIAEVINLQDFGLDQDAKVEFTGLVRFSENIVQYLKTLTPEKIGKTLPDLLTNLYKRGFEFSFLDVQGEWAEFNQPADIAQFVLGTKAQTLARLEPLVRKSHIGAQVSFTPAQWTKNHKEIIRKIQEKFPSGSLIIRSSSSCEDGWLNSNAGGFDSALDVDSDDADLIYSSVSKVIQSYDGNGTGQVLVQAFLKNIDFAGVIFTCNLENGAPYYCFNYDDKSGSTESVTAGTHNDLRTVLLHRDNTETVKSQMPELYPVLQAVQELEHLLGYNRLDIEFAVDIKGQVHIFQVRPITVDHSAYERERGEYNGYLNAGVAFYRRLQKPMPHILGENALFGNMPDWNPAEIIGTRPRPLAFSLYRHIITHEIWAAQRAEFGYRDVRPQPLIVSFMGQPFVDVRASLNSFVPASLDDAAASRIINAYLNVLKENPGFHDKIEFDVAFTIWTPDFMQAAQKRLSPYGVTADDLKKLEEGLKTITAKAFLRLIDDIAPAEKLIDRRLNLKQSELAPLDKFYALIDDCRRFGTLAFSHAARAGFVAITLLKSLVAGGGLSPDRYQAFLKSVHTVTSEFENDKHAYHEKKLSKEDLVERYGHLRPGTYDINAEAYWENPERYLLQKSAKAESPKHSDFTLKGHEQKAMAAILSSLSLQVPAEQAFDYIRRAIQAREQVKFEFTKNLSLALDMIVAFAADHELTRDDVSYLEYDDLAALRCKPINIKHLKDLIKQRKSEFMLSQLSELPFLICQEQDFYIFERHSSHPNFITNKQVEEPVKLLKNHKLEDLSGKIVIIPQADPGYDWLFGCNIKGLMTTYGGANSHMAIRSAELGLPAAIGIGEKLYNKLSTCKIVKLDCANKIIRDVNETDRYNTTG